MWTLAFALVCSFYVGAREAKQKWVALVIGNASYPSAPLKSSVNDARAIGASLSRLGFSVSTVLDANKQTMEMAVLNFAASLDEDTYALFYFAGHGI